MKSVGELRSALSRVPGALLQVDPELADRGDLEARREIWPGRDHAQQGLKGRSVDPPPDKEAGEEDDATEEKAETEQIAEFEELLEFPPVNEDDLVQALGGEKKGREQLQALLEQGGLDAFGSYMTFHQLGRQWGICLNVEPIYLLALYVFKGVPVDLATRIEIVVRLVHQHELFHYAVDYATAQLELLSGRPCWVPGGALRRTRGRGEHRYYDSEEMLANAWMLRAVMRGRQALRLRGRGKALRWMISQQPPGYRDAPSVRASRRFFPAVDRMMREYAEQGGYDRDLFSLVDAHRLLPLAPYIDWRYCPVQFIDADKRLNLPPFMTDLVPLVAGVREAASFRRQLDRLDKRVQKLWPATKDKLIRDAHIRGLDFKHFPGSNGERHYSVRLNRSYRAHIREIDEPPGWEVYSVGSHDEMGH